MPSLYLIRGRLFYSSGLVGWSNPSSTIVVYQNGSHPRAASLLMSLTHRQRKIIKKENRISLSLSLYAYAGILSGHLFSVAQIRQVKPEGGGFFSSSASGYINGLALLLLGHKDEPKPVIVSPWRHYHLVVEETDTKFQLDSSKKWLSRACTSLTCFGRKSDRPENPSQPQDFPSDKRDDAQQSVDYECSNRFALKSSLKKRSFSDALLADEEDDDVSRDNGALNHADRRKVQWPDTCGIEIAEVREFEPSEVDELDDELHHGNRKSCMCTIM
ncbi:uncharacterized protein LOC106368356 isoform X2 [Brassica napus]|uniref:uncharacterized protein LOC106368356 isoform X2 n=1 Tax=Brassica napus TaxID=3708 RepID=UPI000BBF1AA7|nr:uncharacterized protein LOC106368356 isoform X2 [Brassica napus]